MRASDDVVAVGQPRQFCVSEPIAFVGGMDAVVFVVVLVLRGAGGRSTNKHKWGGEGKIRTILFDTKNCLNPPSYFRYLTLRMKCVSNPQPTVQKPTNQGTLVSKFLTNCHFVHNTTNNTNSTHKKSTP